MPTPSVCDVHIFKNIHIASLLKNLLFTYYTMMYFHMYCNEFRIEKLRT